ncbi:hypothetical protein NQZ68_019980 [Dissostichus eleginoides]|nr:hypothetical protein NQZ68_019980 [Dissostichus eleginoides]
MKDIYLFGGKSTNEDGTETSSNEIHKLSISKMKWKVPLYVGIPPARRHGHTTFIIHSHLYVFGGKNEEQEFNDLKVMKLINPSERQPVMKEILSEFGLQGVSHSFTPTKIPNVRYELSESALVHQSSNTTANAQTTDGVIGYHLPDLDQGITELLDSLRCNLAGIGWTETYSATFTGTPHMTRESLGRSFRGGCRGRAPRARDGRDPMGACRRGSRLRPRDIRPTGPAASRN